jgi:uncharacterized damage-inducible protein DinB
MKSTEIQTLFKYDIWAFERVWECITQLSDEQFVEQIDYSTGSIRNIVVHMMSGTSRWISRLQGKDIPLHFAFEDFDTRSKTKARWDELQTAWFNYVKSLSEEQLAETIPWELPARGLKLSNERWEILLHLINHGTDHRAQILAILHHHFHVQTAEQDMILFVGAKKLL